jgi:hypothetical protein
MANEGWMSGPDIARQIGATEYSVNRAIGALGLIDQGKKDMADRRRTIYPPGTLEKVRTWLETH